MDHFFLLNISYITDFFIKKLEHQRNNLEHNIKKNLLKPIQEHCKSAGI